MKEPFLLKWPLVCHTPSEVTTARCQLSKTLLSILFICAFSSSHISVKMSWMWGYINLTTSKNRFLDMAWMPRHWFRVLWNFANPCPETINATAMASPTTVLLDAWTIDDPWKETLLNWHPLQANVMLMVPPRPTVSTLEGISWPKSCSRGVFLEIFEVRH